MQDIFVLLLGGTSIVILLIAFLTYKIKNNFFLKLFALPFTFVYFALMWIVVFGELGKPINEKPEGEFELIHFEIQGDDVEMWAIIDEHSKLYRFPYNREEVKEMKESKDKQEGTPNKVRGEFKKEEKTGTQTFEYELVDPVTEITVYKDSEEIEAVNTPRSDGL